MKIPASCTKPYELCESVASVFNWDWAALCLLTPAAYAEHRRITAAAFAKAFIL